MTRASYKNKEVIVDILTNSFRENKSVNYIKQDKRRETRLRQLMAYSFEVSYMFGEIFMSDDRSACALIVLPDKKKTTPRSILLDLQLILKCT
jgi:hypothetical protein